MSPILDVFDQIYDAESSDCSSEEEEINGLPKQANDDEVKKMMEKFFLENFENEEDDNDDNMESSYDEDTDDAESENL